MAPKSTEAEDAIYVACPPPKVAVEPAALPTNLKLTDAQEKLYLEVEKHFQAEDYVLPGVENGALTEEEKFWLTRECLLRFIRAIKWASAPEGVKRVEATLRWRREFGVYDVINTAHVEPEAVTGKMMIWGYDSDNRPALYLRPSRQNTEESIRQVHYVVWALERLTELMGPGVETLVLMVDFADRAKNPSLGQARTVLNILQTHYPERLGRALVVNIPFLVNAFMKLIIPFIDPLTRPKLRLNPNTLGEGLFAPPELIAEWGGSARVLYEHDKYWGPLVRMCAERRERMWEEWRRLGAKVGVREWDIKCAIELGPAAPAPNPALDAHDAPAPVHVPAVAADPAAAESEATAGAPAITAAPENAVHAAPEAAAPAVSDVSGWAVDASAAGDAD
ncbi:CRAL/TRIO domain-containing protein [Epithele typhae]|uniref:CRAL/TRIO domain-containing protein n=1 Tax=Epithele typhae TaxID=378194 RepID=UPI0020073A61|nr:CRAL/TRIO domain-containing protein [Epithele typhae]KAH9944998.1 CRAL/TRIO domain-containing protein [Epithele typhae]